MNNIELREMKDYFSGTITDRKINKIKNRLRKGTFQYEHFVERKLLNLKKDMPDKRDFNFKLSLSESFTTAIKRISKKVDWAKQMSPVKDQGDFGSCVGFAVAAMKEWQEQREHQREVKLGKKYKRKQDHYDLSEAWIYWKCKEIDPWPDEEGTSIKCAMQVLKKIGVPCDEAYPYSDKFKGKPKSWANLISRWGLIDSYWRCKNLDDLRLALHSSGPVVIGIECFIEIFFTGRDGLVRYPSNPNNVLGGHAICVVGYNDKKQLVKFKNSWGKSWGASGYGYLSYKYINNFMDDAWIAKDLSVTKKNF